MSLSQSALAKAIGVSFQPVQRYGADEIRNSASRLYDLAMNLGVPPACFSDGCPDGEVQSDVAADVDMAVDPNEIAAVVSGYLNIPESEMRCAQMCFN